MILYLPKHQHLLCMDRCPSKLFDILFVSTDESLVALVVEAGNIPRP
uniref:Uncharacterized protein n=1 Tax=Arundo donax TaxID=35708 RepID=A0A0A8XPS8_ARUDO